MLRVLGSPKRLCAGPTRRDFLEAGSASLLGLGLQHLTAPKVLASHDPTFGKAKSCILLFLYGSPSQLEWADMKPDAPAEIRGELKGIRSAVPGLDVCELLPNMAKIMDKVTVVRSMSHPYPLHGVAFATTGVSAIDVPMELNPRDSRHHPYIGSVVDHLDRQTPAGRRRPVPTNIALPWPFSTRRKGEVPRAGPYGAFLGNAFNPLWTEFEGEATRTITKTLQNNSLEMAEPYVGISPEGRFTVAGAAPAGADLTLDRMNGRRSLLEQFDNVRRDGDLAAQNWDRQRQQAFSLMGSVEMRRALDVGREPRPLRDRYGMTVFGQGCLTARRLVEAGSRFVSVFWDEFGLAGSGWDTHWDHYNRMKDELCPGLDMALFGLIGDLDQRGLLDETLVLVLSEHGRTPRINNQKGAGRDHWSQAYTILAAGAGIARGKIVGRTDKQGATVVERPISPKDLLLTAYHLLGIDAETLIHDRLGRPHPVVSNANIVRDLFG